jgi:hypothetical protein
LSILAAFIGILDSAGAARSSVDIKSSSSSRNLLCRPPPPPPLPQKSKRFYSIFLSTRTNRSYNNITKRIPCDGRLLNGSISFDWSFAAFGFVLLLLPVLPSSSRYLYAPICWLSSLDATLQYYTLY